MANAMKIKMKWPDGELFEHIVSRCLRRLQCIVWYNSTSAVGHKFNLEKESSVSRFYRFQGNETTGRKINRDRQLYIHVISLLLPSEIFISFSLFQQSSHFTNAWVVYKKGLIAADMTEYFCE